MLTMVTVDGPRGTLYLPLTDASAGYVVKDIQGLDPVKATMTSSTLATMDGAIFQNVRRETRNITMTIGLESDYVTNTVAGLRTNLYAYLMPKGIVTFSVYDRPGGVFARTVAVVESVDNNMFTSDPEINISLICFDPDLYAPDVTVLQSTSDPNGDLTMIDYPGTSDTGITLDITVPVVSGEVRIVNTRPDAVTQIFRVAGNFTVGDQLTIDTNPGSKKVRIKRAGVDMSGLYLLDKTSNWISLQEGVNQFAVFFNGAPTPYTVRYIVKYGGF
jgi:hypothetical protein